MMILLMHLTRQSINITTGNGVNTTIDDMFTVEVVVAIIIMIALMDGTTKMDVMC